MLLAVFLATCVNTFLGSVGECDCPAPRSLAIGPVFDDGEVAPIIVVCELVSAVVGGGFLGGTPFILERKETSIGHVVSCASLHC